MQEPSKDNSGEKIFVRKKDFLTTASATENVNMVAEVLDHYETAAKNADEFLLDTHGHLIVKHDLFNHDGVTQDGIAEAFAEFAKKERLSFF
jgi:type I restriction enzyme M protein